MMQTLLNVFCQTIAVLVIVLLIYFGKKIWRLFFDKFLRDYSQEESDDNNTDNR